MIVLVDQDGPLCDFETGFLRLWRQTYPGEYYVPIEKRRQFRISLDYPESLRQQVVNLYAAPGFYQSLRPTPFSLEAIKFMVAQGIDVRICTTPILDYDHWVLEKYRWIEKHLGRSFTERLILTRDKTLVKGDFLIDDKPDICGACQPEWQQLLFDEPYNRSSPLPRINWEALPFFLAKLK